MKFKICIMFLTNMSAIQHEIICDHAMVYDGEPGNPGMSQIDFNL